MESARMRGIHKEGPEPTSVTHHLQDSRFKVKNDLQAMLMLFPKDLSTRLAWEEEA